MIACVGGGSNAIGAFYEFLPEPNVALIGVEAGGRGTALGEHAARFAPNGGGVPGVLQGTYSYVLQDAAGQIAATHSVSAGLDYASVGPEHAMLHDSGRATYISATDDEALEAVRVLSRTEGIIPALESAHAIAEAMNGSDDGRRTDCDGESVSGRGDKDMGILTREMNLKEQRSSSCQLLAKVLGANAKDWAETMAIEFRKKPGLLIYLTAGDPDLATTRDMAIAAIDNGADVIELGVPFSDPLADGPVIQRASERAVAQGTRLTRCAGDLQGDSGGAGRGGD